MRKLTAAGLIAAGALGISLQAGAAETVYTLENGVFGKNEHSCTQIVNLFAASDCTYGRNRPTALGNWLGPLFGGGHYTRGSAGDSTGYTPTNNDGKIEAGITGTLTLDDNGTAGDPTDDTVAMNFVIGPMARNVATGQSTRAVQSWDAMTHTVVATPVNAATANGAGGVDYIIGSRGNPPRLCKEGSTADIDCFPNDEITSDFSAPLFWTEIDPGGIGIERSRLLGDPATTTSTPGTEGNLGLTSTATFDGTYACSTNNGASDDCTLSAIVWGALEPAGFDNIVGRISTDSTGAITEAFLYWTEEYFIGAGGPPPGIDNSMQASTIEFTAQSPSTLPNAVDDAATVLEGTTGNIIDVTANDVNFAGALTVTIISGPNIGSATVVGNDISYDADGGTGTATIVYEATDGVDSDQATLTITVQADVLPVAPDGGITVNTQGRNGAAAAANVNVSTLGGYSAGNTPAVVTIFTNANGANGTCTVSGTTVTFTPTASFVNGGASDSCVYRITDNNGDTDDGTLTISITDVTPVVNGDEATGEQNGGDVEASAGFTAGNGSVAQHTLSVTDGDNGSCEVAVAGSNLEVTYSPNADFFGEDSCTVTLTDADGDSDSADFTFTINEVDDEIRLPGGGGAVDPWSLLLLGGLPLLRLRRRS